MFSAARTRLPALSNQTPRFIIRPLSSSPCFHRENRNPVNDPDPPKPPPNVSATNVVPVDAVGARDARLQEAPEEGERQRQLQSPNRAERWSRSQEAREKAMTGPRFEQTIMEFQVSHYSSAPYRALRSIAPADIHGFFFSLNHMQRST